MMTSAMTGCLTWSPEPRRMGLAQPPPARNRRRLRQAEPRPSSVRIRYCRSHSYRFAPATDNVTIRKTILQPPADSDKGHWPLNPIDFHHLSRDGVSFVAIS